MSIYWLLIAMPVAAGLEILGAAAPLIFFVAALAIVPLAALIVHSTEVDGVQSPWRMFGLSQAAQAGNAVGHEPGETAKFQDVFFLPPVLGQGLEGTAVEEVLLLRDEMANMAWAVERVVESPVGTRDLTNP